MGKLKMVSQELGMGRTNCYLVFDEETKEVTEREEGSGTGYGSRIKVSE